MTVQNKEKLLNLLGLAKKAGRIALGHDAVLEAVKKKKAALILLAADASARLEQEMERECAFAHLAAEIVRTEVTMEDIGRALPRKAGVISVNDPSFAQAMKTIIEEG